MVIAWISRNTKILRSLWVTFIIICLLELIGAKWLPKKTFTHTGNIFLFTMPFFVFGLIHIAIMSDILRKSNVKRGILFNLKRSFFWILLIAYAFVVINFLGNFCLKIW
jgi:hypothetical protein